jgi:hypothetical protein
MSEHSTLGIARASTPEELETEKKLADLETKKEEIADLKLTFANLRLALGRFERQYYARIGRLYVELDKLELQIEEYKTRIRLAKERRLSPSEVEEAIDEQFAERHEDARFYEEQTNQYRQAYEKEKAETRLSHEQERELKTLYRRIAKFFHPDLAGSEQEKARKNKTMAEANAAYQEKDLEKLKTIDKTAKEEEARKHETSTEKLARLTRESHELDKEVERLIKALKEVKESPTFKMKDAVERGSAEGRDVLEELANDLETKIQEKRIELEDIIREHRDIMATN